MSRGLWFVAGAGAGIYAMVKARRTAETFTPDGLRDRVAGLNLGAHLFADEVRAGMTEKETELRERLGLALDGPRELTPGQVEELSARPPSGDRTTTDPTTGTTTPDQETQD